MATYDGYTERQMLDVLAQRCQVVKLETVEITEERSDYLVRAWRLYCLSHDHGEFEQTGESLFHLIYSAFKPHKPFADEQRDKLRELGKKLRQNLSAARGELVGEINRTGLDYVALCLGTANKWRVLPKPEADRHEVIECPKCKGKLEMFQSSHNGHVRGQCETEGCLSWME